MKLVEKARAIRRLFVATSRTIWDLFVFTRAIKSGKHADHEEAFVRESVVEWAGRICRICGVETVVHGSFPEPGTGMLITPNHRSYLDIPVLLSAHYCAMLSKAEVAKWPVFGAAAKRVGTQFVRRDSKESRAESLAEISARLEAGAQVAVFPEGTTLPEPDVGPFKPGIFNLAAKSEIEVLPVALKYPGPSYSWIDAESLLSNFMRNFGKKKIIVHVHPGKPLRDSNGTRLREAAENWIRNELNRLYYDKR